MSKTTTVGEAQVTPSPHDVIEIQLVEPAGMPPTVTITWPLQPTVINPEKFGELAGALVKMFSEAHVTLARLRARKYLS
jgi:hypothetical protein